MRINKLAPLFLSNKDNWGTPKYLYDFLNRTYGPFTLDPCASDSNHKCENYFTKETNGLIQDWGSHKTFMNPPYGRKETGLWIKKARISCLKGKTTVVCLVPARTDTKWWHDFVETGLANDQGMVSIEIRFIVGRIKFEGSSTNGAPFPSVVIVYKYENNIFIGPKRIWQDPIILKDIK